MPTTESSTAERCKHGVWLGDACWACDDGERDDEISALIPGRDAFVRRVLQRHDREVRIATLVEAARLTCPWCLDGFPIFCTKAWSRAVARITVQPFHEPFEGGDPFGNCYAEMIIFKLFEEWA